MPIVTAVKASTQDASGGTPVAVAYNEVATLNALQAMVPEGNKSTYTEYQQTTDALGTGITAPNTASDLSCIGGAFGGTSGQNLTTLGNALACEIRASCSTASKTLTGFLVFYNSTPTPVAFSEAVSFTSDATLRNGTAGDFLAIRRLVDCGQAIKARFYTTSVSGGTWGVWVRPL